MTTKAVPLTSDSAEQIGRAWLFHAHKVDLYLAHSRDQLRHIDGFPAGGEGGDGETTPTEGAALARYNVTSTREQIRDDLATIAELSNSFFKVLDRGLRFRPADDVEPPRCDCDPTCENMPSEHTLTDGSRHHGACDECWATKACHCCGRPGDRIVDGLRACQARYRRELRARTQEVA